MTYNSMIYFCGVTQTPQNHNAVLLVSLLNFRGNKQTHGIAGHVSASRLQKEQCTAVIASVELTAVARAKAVLLAR